MPTYLQVVADFPAAKSNHVLPRFSPVLVQKAPLSSCEVCVIVPVRNSCPRKTKAQY
ncbi:MAG: hypothetical protein KME29_21360 [Calothrix sp. FI2-JRJ7]|nr:hypothetical protein [Calothrix sp. FI2-JRJ7]